MNEEMTNMANLIESQRKRIAVRNEVIGSLRKWVLALGLSGLILIVGMIIMIAQVNVAKNTLRDARLKLDEQAIEIKNLQNQINEYTDNAAAETSVDIGEETIAAIDLNHTSPAPESKTQSKYTYDESIPMSKDLQEFAQEQCDSIGFDYKVFLGMIKRESEFDQSAISADGMDYGLCQIRSTNHKWIEDNLGDLDFLNGKDSIRASIFMLSDIMNNYNYNEYHTILMMYNMGPGNAKECFASGIYSSKYSRTVMDNAASFGYTGNGQVS